MFKKLFLGAALGLAGLAMTGEAKAHGPIHGGPVGVGPSYHLRYGVPYTGGRYYYTGRHHAHWGHRVWSPRLSRYHYWDPYIRSYYYWHAPRACYLPVGAPLPF
jgi:hypothetical protein